MTSANGISSMERARVLPSPEELVAKCFELGLIMQRGGPEKSITHPAMTLQGTTIQKSVLDTLYQRQVLWNEAVDNTSRNFEFVAATLRQTAISDASFTGRFLEMLEKIYQQPPPAEFLAGRAWNEPMYQPTMLGIFRTDYMFDPTSPAAGSPDSPDLSARWKNVEINTISVSFAGLSPLVTQFHEYLHAYCQSSQAHGDATKSNLVHSSSGEDVPQSLAMAVTLWNDEVRSNLVCPGVNVAQLQPVVLTVVQEGERNTGDQYKLLFHLLQQHGVRSLRRTLTEVFSDMVLHPTTSASTGSPLPPLAVLDGRYAVAVVYFRSTYTPNDFPTEATWTARYRLECSNAIKCPSLPYHLLTWKKLQQRLADIDGVLAPVALGGDREKAASLGRHFMQLYSLNRAEYAIGGGSHDGDPETWIQAAIADPRRYVLKPQLEGGGNLIAGEAMRTLLRDTTMESNPTLFSRIRKEYILMEKIHYEVKSGAVLRAGEILSLDSNLCSELGIFGVVLSRGKGDVRMNRSAGYIVRSKPADVEDGV